jgi:hypothetical protein
MSTDQKEVSAVDLLTLDRVLRLNLRLEVERRGLPSML